jgi:hypothetical protein
MHPTCPLLQEPCGQLAAFDLQSVDHGRQKSVCAECLSCRWLAKGARQDGKFYGCFDVRELISNSEVNAWSLPVKHLLFESYLGVVYWGIIYTHHRGIGRNWMK